jgi:hypothetical protein
MQIGDWTATPDLCEVYQEIRDLGLETNLAELEAFGFTVIPDALSPDVTGKLRAAVVRSAEKTFGYPLDVENETRHQNINVTTYLLYKDPIFEEAVLAEKPLALITYLLGRSCCLSSLTSHVKGPGPGAGFIHADTNLPTPYSAYSHWANCNYALTDYTQDDGALGVVPGSHRLHRPPMEWERGMRENERNPNVIPIEVKAGTAIVWHGNTWHSSYPRKTPGLRINLATYYCRQHIEPQELYRQNIPDDVLARHGRDSRLAHLLGLHKFNGWAEEGPNLDMRSTMRANHTWQS